MSTTNPSPAERYAAMRSRQSSPLLESFRDTLGFELDRFQTASCAAVEEGKSVLVAAPTGAGKTIVAEFAVYLTMQTASDKIFYTAPIKALSNQKYAEFVARYGNEQVGLLTGDTNINSSARIVVMTTEVLRNMLYANSALLRDLRFVVMDEVHYLADRFRGAVWEEVIIHLADTVRMVSLSATVSNAEEFGDWLQAVRGDTAVIVSEERPVPLTQHVLVSGQLIDLFSAKAKGGGAAVNPELLSLAKGSSGPPHGRVSGRGGRDRRGGGRGRDYGSSPTSRADIVELLSGRLLLPAIFFIFSRFGCDQAVQQVLRSGVTLTTEAERDEIRAVVTEMSRNLADEDLDTLGYWEWLSGLERGVASHHAGLLPAFKEIVEYLFQRKLVKAVFATETLALGINMPARTVVLEKLDKFNGEARVPITAGEYTQLTGRAGRRGIDTEGHSVIQWRGGLDPHSVASLASRRSYPLNSSFRPTYNMSVNLIEEFGRDQTRSILERSFAQFQADRAVVALVTKIRGLDQSIQGYQDQIVCHLGDFAEYAGIRRDLTALEKQRRFEDGSDSASGRRQRSAQLEALRKRMRSHPCHHCPQREEHARWAERSYKLERDRDKLVRQVEKRTGAIARVFDRIGEILLVKGYVKPADPARPDDDWQLTVHGKRLKRIYGERDLLVSECIRKQYWLNLDAPSLAALICTLVYEPRREEGEIADRRLPAGQFREAFERTTDMWAELDELENDHQLPGSIPPAPGLAMAMFRWAKGYPLDQVLFDADLPAGDFVRWSKQTIDLLDQLSVVAEGRLAVTARQALDQVFRGVVAYSGVA